MCENIPSVSPVGFATPNVKPVVALVVVVPNPLPSVSPPAAAVKNVFKYGSSF